MVFRTEPLNSPSSCTIWSLSSIASIDPNWRFRIVGLESLSMHPEPIDRTWLLVQSAAYILIHFPAKGISNVLRPKGNKKLCKLRSNRRLSDEKATIRANRVLGWCVICKFLQPYVHVLYNFNSRLDKIRRWMEIDIITDVCYKVCTWFWNLWGLILDIEDDFVILLTCCFSFMLFIASL